MTLNLLTIVGARPQFIKAAALSRAVADYSSIRETIVHTGQHYDANMSKIFFDELGIPRPDYSLGIGGGSHGQMTGRQIEAIEQVLKAERPDVVLVYGDTNSTLAGSLAAIKLHIPIAHVEAGLRSFNRSMPEEINRVLTDHTANLLFAPTETAMRNLAAEGIDLAQCHLVGDVMYDASLFYRSRARKPEWFAGLGLASGEFALATIHRAENTDSAKRLANILKGLEISGFQVVLPLHPRTRLKLDEFAIGCPDNVHFTQPVGYLEMVWLEDNCRAVATDSGGVQKEAYFFEKPCVTLRDETEWVELVESGWNVLAGTDPRAIADALNSAKAPAMNAPLYGRGDTAVQIVNKLS